MMDGEGCICVDWSPARADGTHRPIVKLSIANTNWLMIRQVKHLFWALTGRRYVASLCVWKQRPRHYHDKWQVFVNRRESIKAVLSAILPYMIGKCKQAHLAIQIASWRPGKRGCQVPPEVMEAARLIKFSNLNPPQPHPDETRETVRRTTAVEDTVQAA